MPERPGPPAGGSRPGVGRVSSSCRSVPVPEVFFRPSAPEKKAQGTALPHRPFHHPRGIPPFSPRIGALWEERPPLIAMPTLPLKPPPTTPLTTQTPLGPSNGGQPPPTRHPASGSNERPMNVGGAGTAHPPWASPPRSRSISFSLSNFPSPRPRPPPACSSRLSPPHWPERNPRSN